MKILHRTPEHITVATASAFRCSCFAFAQNCNIYSVTGVQQATSDIERCCSRSLWALIAFTVGTGYCICFEKANQIINSSHTLFASFAAWLPKVFLLPSLLNSFSKHKSDWISEAKKRLPYCYRPYMSWRCVCKVPEHPIATSEIKRHI